ncbi:HNH endonuclease [Empedobacter falsenii]|uniref:HNH endonuclease n=1 Tax=Empedobacter falsenii TaxID=343874 RepID=UPI002574E434|nr:HNH endonuclease [Empedobacter falsenii]MDM1061327.1 HNH endonuclease [Empedobacter falsenii]
MWIEDLSNALTNLGGYAHYTDIYSEITKLKTNLSNNYKAVIRRTIQQNSSDSQSWNGKNDLFYSVEGIGKGIWGLRNYTPQNVVNENQENFTNGNLNPERKNYSISRIIRDTELSRRLKAQHNHICEVCSTQLKLKENSFYSEAHHIKPLGYPHNGPDTEDNIIVVCPNCHVLLDNFIIELVNKSLKRKLNDEYIQYHNQLVIKI